MMMFNITTMMTMMVMMMVMALMIHIDGDNDNDDNGDDDVDDGFFHSVISFFSQAYDYAFILDVHLPDFLLDTAKCKYPLRRNQKYGSPQQKTNGALSILSRVLRLLLLLQLRYRFLRWTLMI